MNFIPAQSMAGTVTLSNGAELPGGLEASGSVTLGLRPEHLIPDANGPLRIVVQMFEHLGATTLMHGTLDKTNIDVVASLPGHVSADSGSVMTFSAAADNMHIFDTETGKRVVK